MAQIIVCDICGAKPAKLIQVCVGRSFDGVETTDDHECLDACLDHAVMLARLAIEQLPKEQRAGALKRPRQS